MNEVAKLRADLAAWKAACELRDRRWTAAFSGVEVLANRWRMDNNELDYPLPHERPHPWEDFVASLPAADARPERVVPEPPRDVERVAEAPTASVEDAWSEIESLESPEAADACLEEAPASEPDVERSRSRFYSKYVGVSRVRDRYHAKIRVDGVNTSLGTFAREVDAAKAFDAKSRELGRPRLNFPAAAADESAAVAPEDRRKSTGWRSGPRNEVYTPSKYTGVHRQRGRWVAQIYVQGKTAIIGSFPSEIDAAKAFDARARQVGRLKNLNFPAADDGASSPAPPETEAASLKVVLRAEAPDARVEEASDPEEAAAASAAPPSRETLSSYSKYIGVTQRVRRTGRNVTHTKAYFNAKISVKGKMEYVGSFPSEVEAALAYDARAREAGDFKTGSKEGHIGGRPRKRKLNFPTAEELRTLMPPSKFQRGRGPSAAEAG